jgi:methylglutamate dehydrogenase subunit D
VAEGVHPIVSALDGVAAPGRHGRRTADPGVTVSEVRGGGLALVTARRGARAALAETVRVAFGVALPEARRTTEGAELAFVWCGPEQWLAYCRSAPREGMERLLAPLIAHAAIVDQSHGRTILRVAGPKVREALAKGVAVDLHPRAFKTGDTAATLVAHIAVQIWQVDDAPTYEFAVARGFAQSFWDWLESSSAEFGLELVGNTRTA